MADCYGQLLPADGWLLAANRYAMMLFDETSNALCR